VAELSAQWQVPLRLLAFDSRGLEAWQCGSAPAEGAVSVPVLRLGQRLGELQLPAAAAAHLAPVLPVLAALLHRAEVSAARYSGPDAELIRAALAGAGTFVWEWWIESDWLTDIDQGLQLLGYPADRFGHTQQDWNALIHPDDLGANDEAYQRHERGELEFYEHAYRIRDAQGRWRWMLERGRIVERDAEGRPLRMVGTQTDITEWRELERAREEAAEAQAASRAKTEFLARMSHELRTPLNAVLGFTQLMQIDRDEPPQPEQARRLQLIREAGDHLLQMINDLLDLTRIESGALALAPATLELRELVTQVFALLSELARRDGVALQLDDGAPLVLHADRTRLRQVLLNLVSNAIKYNRRGGQVTLRLQALPEGVARVQVEDTGVGIAAEQMARLFEPFHRGAQASGNVEGTGIGLALTRALVQRMGGTLQVQSEPGVGSVFTLQLPDPPAQPA
jgi:PAS domain S-box-containing protein